MAYLAMGQKPCKLLFKTAGKWMFVPPSLSDVSCFMKEKGSNMIKHMGLSENLVHRNLIIDIIMLLVESCCIQDI